MGGYRLSGYTVYKQQNLQRRLLHLWKIYKLKN
jgi:hypothetical protein